jgi:small subunit ribosomal protein S12
MATIRQRVRDPKVGKKKRRRVPILGGCPQKRGICRKVFTMTPRKPNSAIRKVCKIKVRWKRRVAVYIPGIGHNIQKYSEVLIIGGRAKDLPGVHYTLLKGKLDFAREESFKRTKKRSKYGLKKEREK